MTAASEAAIERKATMAGWVTVVSQGEGVSSHVDHLAIAAARVAVDECHACPLGDASPSRVPYAGGPSSIMFVGEAPGREEAESGLPFVGPSGLLLHAMLEEVGIENPAIGNTICCRPPFNNYDKAIEFGAPQACRPHLTSALETSGAWIVVSVGGKAAASFGHVGSVSSAVGRWRWHDGRLHTTIWHPSYIMRRGGTSSSEYDGNLEVLREVKRVSEGVGRYTPDAPLLMSSIGSATATEVVREALNKSGYVPIFSKVLGCNVVLYDAARVERGSSIKLPPGFDEPIYFTVNELARLKRPADVRRVAALKAVIDVEVMA